MKTVVILPTYNEAIAAPIVVEQLLKLYPDLHVWVVDDNSPDGTAEKVTAYVNRNIPDSAVRFRVIIRQTNRGLARAVICGLEDARRRGYRVAVIMDADDQHPREAVGRLIARLEYAELGWVASIVVGSRHAAFGGGFSEDVPKSRKFISDASNILINPYGWQGKGRIRDMTSGFFAVRLDENFIIPEPNIGFKILIMTLQANPLLSVVEVGYKFQPRIGGESKASIREWLLMFRQAWTGS